jgi:hypothetical protein
VSETRSVISFCARSISYTKFGFIVRFAAGLRLAMSELFSTAIGGMLENME